jgi:hypothetical protein
MDGYKKCPQRPLQIHLTDTRGREHSRSFILSIFYGYVLLAKTGEGGDVRAVYINSRDTRLKKTTFRLLHFHVFFL